MSKFTPCKWTWDMIPRKKGTIPITTPRREPRELQLPVLFQPAVRADRLRRQLHDASERPQGLHVVFAPARGL